MLAFWVALLFLILIGACQRKEFTEVNITNQPGGGPITDPLVLDGEKLVVTNASLAGIRNAFIQLQPSAVVHVNRNAPPQACLGGGEACITLNFQTSSSPDLKTEFVTTPLGSQFITSFLLNLQPPVLADQVEGTAFEYLGDINGLSAYDLSFLHNPVDGIRVRAMGENLGTRGLFFHVFVDFPVSNHVGDFFCNCDGFSNLPQPPGSPPGFDPCDEICASLDDNFDCDFLNIAIKINRIELNIGFDPRMPPTSNGFWTEEFGGKDFHLSRMFALPILVSGGATKNAHTDYFDVTFSNFKGVVVGARGFECSPICSLTDCDTPISEGLAKSFASKLGAAFASAVQTELAPLFNYDKDTLPTPCVLGGTCSDQQTRDWASVALTYQKWDWFAGAFGPYPNGDSLLIQGFNKPLNQEILEVVFETDPDDDGVPTPDDNCPLVDQDFPLNFDDSDNDGRGDVCDLCPNDASNDRDGDGHCENVDNCRNLFNSSQRNANSLAEQAHGARPLGDACDPVPTPSHRSTGPVEAETQIICPKPCGPLTGTPCPQGCPPTPYTGTVVLKCGLKLNNTMEIRPLRSHDLPVQPPGQPIPPIPAGLIPTYARFCHKHSGIACNDPNVDIDDSLAFEADCFDPAVVPGCIKPELPEHHFHRVTFFNPGEGNRIDPDGNEAELSYDRVASDSIAPPDFVPWTWNFSSDLVRWVGAGLIVDPGSNDGLVGNFWLHTETEIGDSIDIGTGRHPYFISIPPAPPVAEPGQLSNDYDLGHDGDGLRPLQLFCRACGVAGLPLVAEGPGGQEFADAISQYLIWRPLPDPPVESFQRFDAEVGEADYVINAAADLWGVPTPRPDCGTEIVNDRLGPHLVLRLTDPALVWANAAEPYSGQGAGPAFPLAVALSRVGGSELVDTVVTNGTGLLADRDRGIVRDPHRAGSPHAVDYIPVLTRMHRGVFVVGGQDLQTGLPTGEIWFTPLSGNRWNEVPSDRKPEKVLAATYNFATDELYVLDETADGLARLWGIELKRIHVRTVGSWPRHPEWNRQWLVVDRDGALLVASSNASGKKHKIARIDVREPKPAQIGIMSDHRALVMPPLVDGAGYMLLTRQSQGNGKIKRDRKVQLDFAAGTLGDLGEQL